MGDGSLSSEAAEGIRVEGKDTLGTHATHTVLLECNQGTRRVVVLFMVNPECQEIFFFFSPSISISHLHAVQQRDELKKNSLHLKF